MSNKTPTSDILITTSTSTPTTSSSATTTVTSSPVTTSSSTTNVATTTKPSRKRKRLTLDVFGRSVKVGCLPGPLHSDVRTMLLKYVREVRAKGRHQSISLSKPRLENVETALRENGEEVKSLNDLRNMVQHRYNSFSVSAESIDTYYTEKRAEGYNKVCAGPQYTMSKRCVELSGKIKKHALVLDVACGSGLSSDTISKEYGFGVIGCDVSSGMLSKAKSEGKRAIDYVRTDMSQPMPFRANVFDTAFSVSAIHYLAEDVPPRSAKARMSTFFRELRRTTSTNANITCQFHEKRGKEKTHKALQDAALESWKASDLVLDQPHETSAQRWFLCLSNNRSNVEKKCPVSWPKNATCPLIYAKQCATTVCPQHLKWLQNDHAKYARRLIRCVNRHLEAPDHPYLPKLSEEEKTLGLKLRDRFGSSVSLETLQVKRLDELISFLHGYLS